jgi:hypothetical protein
MGISTINNKFISLEMKSLTQPEGVSGVLSYGLYQLYRKKFTKSDVHCDANVHWQQWLRICRKFNERKMESILRGQIFNMPFRLGSIGIVQYKRTIRFDENGKLLTHGLVPDWNKTWILWKKLYPECKTKEDFKNVKHKQVVFQTNEHTDGRIFRFHWKKKYCNIKNISAYELHIPPRYKRELGKIIFSNPNVQYCEKF